VPIAHDLPILMMRMRFATYLMTCEQRRVVLGDTLRSLRASGWQQSPEVVVDDGAGNDPLDRITRTWLRVIERAAGETSDFVLMLEDDVVFGRFFAENLRSWPRLRNLAPGRPFFASLYNAERAYYVSRPRERYLVAHPTSTWGSQALVTTPETLRFILARWDTQPNAIADQRMARIASLVTPIYYHVPSLVNQARVPSTWLRANDSHAAIDFDPEWRAEPPSAPALTRNG
jgi:hypothetical protein